MIRRDNNLLSVFGGANGFMVGHQYSFGENRFGGSDIVKYCYERSQAWRLIKNVIRDEIRLLHFLKLLKS